MFPGKDVCFAIIFWKTGKFIYFRKTFFIFTFQENLFYILSEMFRKNIFVSLNFSEKHVYLAIFLFSFIYLPKNYFK
uniref:Uncharacterized protein n=1 Tax=Meloidogyne enterolobii TaxID=390850 RepID=A0A6V7UFH8_MELEN|nr:unnamed protein product [Meloidogyne enterolobii]